jgi:hypothetical protein
VTATTLFIVAIASQLVYGEWASGVTIAIASRPTLLAVTALVLALAGVATLCAAWRGRGGLGPPLALLATGAALVTPLYAGVTMLLAPHVPTNDVVVSPWGVRCMAIAALVGVSVLGAFGWALHRAAPAATAGRGAMLGACAGAWAGLAVFLFCPSAEQQHLLLGHVLPVAALALVGTLLLPRALRP